MELLKPIIDSGNTEKLLGTYLRSCQEQLSFITEDASEEKKLITAINSKLNEPSTRFVGLSLLHTFLQSCPQQTVNDNAISWLSLCSKGTVSPVASTCNLSYHVLSSLFHRCSDQAKHVASAVLPKLFEHLQSVPKHSIPAALICLESCMKIYNGSCGPHKNTIQNFLIPLLEYSGPNKEAVLWKASVCLALVPQIGGGGAGGVTYQENWTKQLKVACSTLHEILDVLFSSVHELEIHNVEETREETFKFESINEQDTIAKAYTLASRFEGVVRCIQAMLLGEFGVVKNVTPSAVFSVICRGLAVTSVSLQSTTTTESLVLLTILPNLQTKLFELMRALIDCCGANLLPFGRLVVKLVLQTLKWTTVEHWKHKTRKPYRTLRSAAYDCMKFWLESVRTVPSCDELAELVDIACGDLRVVDDGVRLIPGKKKNKCSNKNEAKKKRSSNAATEVDDSPLDPAANVEVCVAALQTVQILLAVHGWALNGGSYDILNETAVKLVLSVSGHPQNHVIPFGEPKARLELYRLLSALVSHPHPHVPSPIRMAWKLFSLGQNDPNIRVSTFCCEALSNVEKIVHPSFGPLTLPIPETEEEKNASDSLLASLTGGENQTTKVADLSSVSEEIIVKNKKKQKNSSSKQTSGKTKKKFVKEPIKSDDLGSDKALPKKNPEEVVDKDKLSNGVDQEMIDVSDSGSNGADIEEVPVEIDLADSEASDKDEPATRLSAEVADGIEIIDEVDRSSVVDDFRLVISPELGPLMTGDDVSRGSKRRGESLRDEAKEKSVVSSSRPMNGDDAPPPQKVLVVDQDAGDGDLDAEAMLAAFVDKVKPLCDAL